MRKRYVEAVSAFLEQCPLQKLDDLETEIEQSQKAEKIAFEQMLADPMEAEVKELFLAEMVKAGVVTGAGDDRWAPMTLEKVVFHAEDCPDAIALSESLFTPALANELASLTQQLQSAVCDVTEKLRAVRDSYRSEADMYDHLLGEMPTSPACSRLETLQAEVVLAMCQEREVWRGADRLKLIKKTPADGQNM